MKLIKKIPVYNEREREGLRVAGRFNAGLMDYLRPFVKAGITTLELDRLAYEYTVGHGHVPACLGYLNYPKTICTSVNEVVCHGVPDNRPLRDGDIVNVDVTSIVNGWYGDLSETFTIGEVSDEAKKLVQATFEALWIGIRAIEPFGMVRDIGRAISNFAKSKGLSVVQEYQGHGIGRAFHQEPGIPHFEQDKGGRVRLEPGMCFTIEPMLNVGTWKTEIDGSDGWTVRTKDRQLSAQFEHTVIMTSKGPEITTLTQNGPKEGDKLF